MPVFMKYDGVDGQFNETDRFDFSRLTIEPTAPENKPSLIVKLDIGGPTLSPDGGYVLTGTQQGADADGADYSGSHALYQDVSIPAAQTDDFLLLPAVQEIARTNKPSLVVKFDIGGAPAVQDDALLLHGSDFLV